MTVHRTSIKELWAKTASTVEPHEYGHQWAKKKNGRINEVFFLQENVWSFCQAVKKSGRNNEVTVYYRGGRKKRGGGVHCTFISNVESKLCLSSIRNASLLIQRK